MVVVLATLSLGNKALALPKQPRCSILKYLEKSNETIKVNSGWRSPEHNRKVGGVPNSFHLKRCGAFDIAKKPIKQKKAFIKYILKKFRVIEYSNHYHIDTAKPTHLKGNYGKHI